MGQAESEPTYEASFTFSGKMGLAYDQDTGDVVNVLEGMPGKRFGVQPGWKILRVDGVVYSFNHLSQKGSRSGPYRVTFLAKGVADVPQQEAPRPTALTFAESEASIADSDFGLSDKQLEQLLSRHAKDGQAQPGRETDQEADQDGEEAAQDGKEADQGEDQREIVRQGRRAKSALHGTRSPESVTRSGSRVRIISEADAITDSIDSAAAESLSPSTRNEVRAQSRNDHHKIGVPPLWTPGELPPLERPQRLEQYCGCEAVKSRNCSVQSVGDLCAGVDDARKDSQISMQPPPEGAVVMYR